jgi:hypothetical protein
MDERLPVVGVEGTWRTVAGRLSTGCASSAPRGRRAWPCSAEGNARSADVPPVGGLQYTGVCALPAELVHDVARLPQFASIRQRSIAALVPSSRCTPGKLGLSQPFQSCVKRLRCRHVGAAAAASAPNVTQVK